MIDPNDPAYPNGPIHMMNMEGLTKREYFAGLAMQGMLSNAINHREAAVDLAICAKAMADALIAELNKSK